MGFFDWLSGSSAKSAEPGTGIYAQIQLNKSGTQRLRSQRGILRFHELSPVLYSIGAKLGQLQASVQWRTYRADGPGAKALRLELRTLPAERRFKRVSDVRKGKASDVELTEVPNHKMLDLLCNGDGILLGSQIWGLMTIYYELLGEVFNEMDSPKSPSQWSPIPPTAVEEFPK